MSDYYYLHALSQQCRSTGRPALPDDIYITPCGGTKLVGNVASLFLGQKVRPLVLLDGDDAARVRQNQLIKELYAGHQAWILMLDEVLERPGEEVEIEDILGETLIVPAVSTVIGRELALDDADRASGSLPTQIKIAAERQSIELPDGWKASAALQLVSTWAQQGTILPHEVLDRAARLFAAIDERFEEARSKEGTPG